MGTPDLPRGAAASTRARAPVLGHPLDLVDLGDASRQVVRMARAGRSARVITLNPEIVVRARHDPALAAAIDTADLCVADGIGIVWAARRAGHRVPGRVPGVELVETTLQRGGEHLEVYFLGGRPGVARAAADEAARRFHVRIAGARDGYFSDEEVPSVVAEVASSGANLLLAGLGERQETFLAANAGALGPRTAIGVGGTLDVLAGTARRTPVWTRRLGLEWAWRVGLDPKRWHRAPRLLRFVDLVVRAPEPKRRG